MTEVKTTHEDMALLVAFVDGELALEESALLEQRLASESDLAAALHTFLAADDLGRQLGGSGLIAGTRRPTARRAAAVWIAATLAAAAALFVALWRPAEAEASFQVTDIAKATPRSGSAAGVEFRVKVKCARECYVLLLTVTTTGAAVTVTQQHPLVTGPLAPRIPDWPKDPFPAGSEFVLPPTKSYPSPTNSYPFSVPDRGLVLLCTKTDGPFQADVIRQVRGMWRLL